MSIRDYGPDRKGCDSITICHQGAVSLKSCKMAGGDIGVAVRIRGPPNGRRKCFVHFFPLWLVVIASGFSSSSCIWRITTSPF